MYFYPIDGGAFLLILLMGFIVLAGYVAYKYLPQVILIVLLLGVIWVLNLLAKADALQWFGVVRNTSEVFSNTSDIFQNTSDVFRDTSDVFRGMVNVLFFRAFIFFQNRQTHFLTTTT